MATITLNIPDHTGLDLAEVKAKVSLYAQHLVSALSHKDEKKADAATSTGRASKMSTLFGSIDITGEEPLDDIRSRALSSKYGL